MKGLTRVDNPESLAKLSDAEKRHETISRNEKLLKMQLDDVEVNLRKLKALFEHDSEAFGRLDTNLKEKLLNYEGAVRQLAKVKDDSNEKLVDNSLMKMRVHQLEEREKRLLSNCFNMEKHKCELELAINERLVTIQTEINVLTLRKKLLGEEKSQLKADIADRKRNIEAMKARFELASQLLGRTEDGEVISTVQLKIKTAQEKEMLLDEGSSLNEKVIQAEKDIVALENTLIMMNFSNDKYKRGLHLVEEVDGKIHIWIQLFFLIRNYDLFQSTLSEDEMAELTAVNDQLAESQNKLKILKANIVMKTRMLGEIKSQCSQIEKDLEDIHQSRWAQHPFILLLVNNDYRFSSSEQNHQQRRSHQNPQRDFRTEIETRSSRTRNEARPKSDGAKSRRSELHQLF